MNCGGWDSVNVGIWSSESELKIPIALTHSTKGFVLPTKKATVLQVWNELMKKCLPKNCTGKCTSIFHDCGLTRSFSSQIQLTRKVKADRTVKVMYLIFRNAMPFFICQLPQSSTHCLISLAFSYIFYLSAPVSGPGASSVFSYAWSLVKFGCAFAFFICFHL